MKVAGTRRYHEFLLFQYGALDGLLSMREVSSDMSTANDLTARLRSLREGWATDLVRFVGEQSDLPDPAAQQLLQFNRDCFSAAKLVRRLEDALLTTLGDVEMALERLVNFWQDVQQAYVTESGAPTSQPGLPQVAMGSMRRRIARLDKSFHTAQAAFHGVA